MTQNILQSLDAVERWLARSPRCLVCADFDGTLVSLVDHQAEVSLPPRRRELLASLARQPGCQCAVLSGRALDDVRQRVALPELIYAGNHGLEIAGPSLTFREPGAPKWQRALHDLCRDLAVPLGDVPGVEVENKGLSATVHYRRAAAQDWAAIAHLVRMTVLAYGDYFWIANGNRAHEIRPRVEWNKGCAVRWLLRTLEVPEHAVLYLGDARTDEDAFQALPSGMTLHIGGSDLSAARWHLPDAEAVEVFLIYLNHRAGCRASGTNFANFAKGGRKTN
jgi:trehalose-phosphatase